MPAPAAEVCPVTSGAAPGAPPAAHAPFRVLVFSRTTGFRHASIPAAITAVEVLGSVNNFTVEATEDATAFTDTNLARFAAVVFLNTTGDVLRREDGSRTPDQLAAWLRRRAGVVHGDGPHRVQLQRTTVPRPLARRDRMGGRGSVAAGVL